MNGYWPAIFQSGSWQFLAIWTGAWKRTSLLFNCSKAREFKCTMTRVDLLLRALKFIWNSAVCELAVEYISNNSSYFRNWITLTDLYCPDYAVKWHLLSSKKGPYSRFWRLQTIPLLKYCCRFFLRSHWEMPAANFPAGWINKISKTSN